MVPPDTVPLGMLALDTLPSVRALLPRAMLADGWPAPVDGVAVCWPLGWEAEACRWESSVPAARGAEPAAAGRADGSAEAVSRPAEVSRAGAVSRAAEVSRALGRLVGVLGT